MHMPRHRMLLLLALCAFAASELANAADRPASRKRTAPTVIENCVSGDKLAFREGESGTLLGELDRFQVADEIVRRYPMIQRDGFYPTSSALWRRKQGDWVFATLVARPQPPHELCFTANVAAGQVSLAPQLLKKYFGISPAPI
jgi:hypothetical protein